MIKKQWARYDFRQVIISFLVNMQHHKKYHNIRAVFPSLVGFSLVLEINVVKSTKTNRKQTLSRIRLFSHDAVIPKVTQK